MAFHLEKEALIASGLQDPHRIAAYLAKIESLSEKFMDTVPSPPDSPQTLAELLFHWLWKQKPDRYKPGGTFRLHLAIDAQLGEGKEAVGNCLGLTLLYNCLLRRIGIEPTALHLEFAFGVGPHVLSLLRIDDREIHVENIFPDGFDYVGHRESPCRVPWGSRELVADIYQSAGTEDFLKEDFLHALASYDKALDLNPFYEKARLNRAILLDAMKMKKRL